MPLENTSLVLGFDSLVDDRQQLSADVPQPLMSLCGRCRITMSEDRASQICLAWEEETHLLNVLLRSQNKHGHCKKKKKQPNINNKILFSISRPKAKQTLAAAQKVFPMNLKLLLPGNISLPFLAVIKVWNKKKTLDN